MYFFIIVLFGIPRVAEALAEALPKKEPKKSSPLNPIPPRKPKFPTIAQGHESHPFWLSSIRRPGKRTGQRAFQIAKVVHYYNIRIKSNILTLSLCS